jgi:hypothetical protein
MTTCILHLNFACHYLVAKPTFRILSQRRAVTWIPLPTTQSARSHGGLHTCEPIRIVAGGATLLGTRVGSELEPAVRQVPDFAAQAGSPSNRVTDTRIGRGVRSASRWTMRAPSSVIFDAVATRITYPPTGPLTAMTRSADGQHQPATPVGRQIDFTTTSLAQRHKDCTGEVPWPGK